ncbi:hypothetical protein SAMN05216176_108212 [Nitratireductor indicus]|nr:hypothetical protein SAMN05216176_108212 [Nitratireductor indicus]
MACGQTGDWARPLEVDKPGRRNQLLIAWRKWMCGPDITGAVRHFIETQGRANSLFVRIYADVR